MRPLSQVKFGSYEGTGAAVSIACKFKPVLVFVLNEEDGDVWWLHVRGMTDAYALQNTNHADTQNSVLSSNGITLTANGFTAGTSLSESGKTFRYIAI